MIYWQQKDYEQALAVLRPLADDLKLTSVYNTLGAISVEAARAEKKNKGKSDAFLKDGLEFLSKAAESSPDESLSQFNYGLALFLNNQFKESVEQFRPILARNQTDGEAYFLLSKSLQKLGDSTASNFDNLARKYLTYKPNDYAKLETEWQRAGSLDSINLRVEQPLRKDFVSAILIKGKDTTPIQTTVNETDALLAQAKDLYKAGNDDEAMQILRRVLASESMSAEAYLLLGNIHLRRGDLDQAKDSLKTALFWDNRLIEGHIALGKIYLEKKDCPQAQNYTRLALELDANNEQALALQRSVERCSK